jgi:hypothetical protein
LAKRADSGPGLVDPFAGLFHISAGDISRRVRQSCANIGQQRHELTFIGKQLYWRANVCQLKGARIRKSMTPLDLTKLKVLPLAQRHSLARLEETLIDPQKKPAPVSEPNEALIWRCANNIARARQRGASVMLIYGAHLIKNGAWLKARQ